MRPNALVLALAALVAAAPLHAQSTGPRVVLVQAGQLLDRPGRAARGPSTIVIRDGRIAELRDGHLDAAAAGYPAAEVVDLRSHYVLPGLIDSHVHLASDTGGVLSQLEEVQLDPAAKAYNALANAHKTLAAGFTTVRNLGDRDGVTLALRDAIRAGKVVDRTSSTPGRRFPPPPVTWTRHSASATTCAGRSTGTRTSATAPTTAGAPCGGRWRAAWT